MLYIPPKDSSKGDNGKLLYIGGSKIYSGASILALKVAVKFSDIVLFYPAEYDKFLISSIKTSVPEVIVVDNIHKAIKNADAILFGSGMGDALFNFSLIRKFEGNVVIDGDGLNFVDGELYKNFLLTPNKKELEMLLLKFKKKNIKELSVLLKSLILSKGPINKLCYGRKTKIIAGGNAGLTKAGTGDVLAGLIASLSTKNSLWNSALYGLRAILYASNSLYKQKSYYYSAFDLVDIVPYSLYKVVKS